MVHLETDRLILRDLEPTDAAGMFALDSDPAVHRYLGNKPLTNIQQSVEVIEMVRAQYRTIGIGRWAVVEKATGAFVGWTGLKRETELRKPMEYMDPGYRLRPPFWGKGYATEAAKACLQYGFEKLGLREINAAADVANAASNRVLIKLGFRHLETFKYEGEDINWYALDPNTFLKNKA